MKGIIEKPINYLKEGYDDLVSDMTRGWNNLKENARNALTEFTRDEEEENIKWNYHFFPGIRWGFLGSDVLYTKEEIIVRLEVPGMNKEDLEIYVYDRYLLVKGKKKRLTVEEPHNYYLVECASGYFQRKLPLPFPVEEDATKVEYDKGILELRFPYKIKRRKIKVN